MKIKIKEDLLNKEEGELFLESDHKNVNFFGDKEEPSGIDGNFLDYLKETGPRESTKQGSGLQDEIMDSVRQYYC